MMMTKIIMMMRLSCNVAFHDKYTKSCRALRPTKWCPLLRITTRNRTNKFC